MASQPWLNKDRLETLVDGIFAIAMTLLILNIRVPAMTHGEATARLSTVLTDLRPHFMAFTISFLLLAVFWMAHHRQFHYIAKVDGAFIWLNIVMLMLIVLVPFTTSLMGEYETHWLANFLFECNLFLIGSSMLFYWWYAGKNNRLTSPDTPAEIFRYGFRRSLVLPGISLAAMGLSLVTPQYSTMAYLAVPVVLGSLDRH